MKTIRFGILGTASIARALVPAVRANPGCEVAAVASRDVAKARAFAGELGIPRALDGYAALLDRDLVDAVYCPLPNSLHAEWTVRALEAGLPVLCEKPLARDAAEARVVAAAAARAGLPVAEAFMYRFHPQWAVLDAMLQAGHVGRVTVVDSRFTFPLDDRDALPARADLAGGSLMDVGCYCVELSRRLAGCEPSRVSAFERRTAVDDTMVGLLEFPGGVLARFESSIESHERQDAEVSGTAGSIRIASPWLAGAAGGRLVLRRDGRPDETVETAGADPYALEVADFAAAVRDRRPPRWGMADAVANLAVIDALYASAREGRAIPVTR